MNKNQTAIALAAVVIAAAAVECIQIHRIEKKKRKNLSVETDKQILAIFRSGTVIQERIRNGKYDGNFSQIPTDLKFETIVARFED